MTDVSEAEGWARGLDELAGRLAPRFGRAEPRRRVLAYLRGLLAPAERRRGGERPAALRLGLPALPRRRPGRLGQGAPDPAQARRAGRSRLLPDPGAPGHGPRHAGAGGGDALDDRELLRGGQGRGRARPVWVRSWAGWHRHITLAMLAHAYLSVIRKAAVGGGGRGSRPRGRVAALHRAGGAPAALATGLGTPTRSRHHPGLVTLAPTPPAARPPLPLAAPDRLP
jgi:hypothetical protein